MSHKHIRQMHDAIDDALGSDHSPKLVDFEIDGVARVGTLTSFLISCSAWFIVEPQPNDTWRVIVKDEHEQGVRKFIESVFG